MSKERLSEKLQAYAKAYKEPPYGREVDGTVELLEEAADKLAEYEDLEEQGLLLRLPCKAGDTLYKVYKRPTKCTIHGKYKDVYACQGCEELECDSSYCWDIYVCKPNIKEIVCNSDDIGKTVFLTQSEAEDKLRELEGK